MAKVFKKLLEAHFKRHPERPPEYCPKYTLIIIIKSKKKSKEFLYWAIKCSNFQEATQSTNSQTFTNEQINVIFITAAVQIT